MEEMRQAEAILSGRRHRPVATCGHGSCGCYQRSWSFWFFVIALQVLALLWVSWAYGVFTDMKAKYRS